MRPQRQAIGERDNLVMLRGPFAFLVAFPVLVFLFSFTIQILAILRFL